MQEREKERAVLHIGIKDGEGRLPNPVHDLLWLVVLRHSNLLALSFLHSLSSLWLVLPTSLSLSLSLSSRGREFTPGDPLSVALHIFISDSKLLCVLFNKLIGGSCYFKKFFGSPESRDASRGCVGLAAM